MATETKAPEGKTRLIGVDLFDHSDYLVDDFESRETALEEARAHNAKRRKKMDDVYYVYDDQGNFIPVPGQGKLEISP